MDDDVIEELRLLRARAYGPSADIGEADLRRLEQLEAMNRPADPDQGTVDAVEEAVTDAAPVEVHDVAEAGAPSDAPEATPRLSGRIRAMWTASVAVAVAVAVVGTLAVTLPLTPIAPAAGRDDVRSIATLSVDPGFVPPKFFGEGEGDIHGFEDFYGLTAVYVDTIWGSERADRCILVMETAKIDPDSDSFSGFMNNGCGAGPFPATVEMLVDETMPQELREMFADGTAIQFVLDGSRIGVFADAE